MMSISSLVLTLAATSLAQATTPFLIFNPPSLSLNDAMALQNSSGFQFKLSSAPTDGDVSVFFSGPGISFASSSLAVGAVGSYTGGCNAPAIFNSSNYNVWQNVSVVGVPVFTNQTQSEVDIIGRAFHGASGSVYNDTALPVTRVIAPGQGCTSIGDPHYSDFDGTAYTHMGLGKYSIFEHEHLSVQSIFQVYSGTATVNQAIAIRYGSSIMVLDVRVDVASLMTVVTPNVDGIVYTAPTAGNGVHGIALPCGSTISLTAIKDAVNTYINVDLHLSAGYQSNGGTCNQKGAAGKYWTATGGFVTDMDAFFSSWVVADADDLFTGKYIASSPPHSLPGSTCSLPTFLAPPPTPAPVVVLPTYTAPSPAAATSTPIVIAAPPATYVNATNDHCQKIFVDTECSKLVPTDFYVKSCVSDCLMSGSYAIAEATRQAYFSKCHIMTKYGTANPDAAVAAQAQAIQKSVGLASYTCSNSCSSHGTCGSNGCICDAGFTSNDCSISMAPLAAYNPKTMNYTINSPCNEVPPVAYAAAPASASTSLNVSAVPAAATVASSSADTTYSTSSTYTPSSYASPAAATNNHVYSSATTNVGSLAFIALGLFNLL